MGGNLQVRLEIHAAVVGFAEARIDEEKLRLLPVDGDGEVPRGGLTRLGPEEDFHFRQFQFCQGPTPREHLLGEVESDFPGVVGSRIQPFRRIILAKIEIFSGWAGEARHNVSGDDRSVLPLPGPVRLAVQVEEPT